jgi:hypothetical protein
LLPARLPARPPILAPSFLPLLQHIALTEIRSLLIFVIFQLGIITAEQVPLSMQCSTLQGWEWGSVGGKLRH